LAKIRQKSGKILCLQNFDVVPAESPFIYSLIAQTGRRGILGREIGAG
jgi:hypothetical protein